MPGYDSTYLQATDVELNDERVFRLDRIEAVWRGEVLAMGTVSQQVYKTSSPAVPHQQQDDKNDNDQKTSEGTKPLIHLR